VVDLINLKSWIVYIIVLVGPNNLEKIPYPIDSASDCFKVGEKIIQEIGVYHAQSELRDQGYYRISDDRLIVGFYCDTIK